MLGDQHGDAVDHRRKLRGDRVERLRAGTGNFGFDAARRQYVDVVENGIIDPTKVIRIALENAVSAASLLLLTEAVLTEVPEKKEEPPAHME